MIRWLADRITSPPADLAITALISGVVVGVSILTVQNAGRHTKIADLKRSIPALEDEQNTHDVAVINDIGGASYLHPQDKEDNRSAVLAARARAGDYDEDLILEQLARNRVFLTDEGLANLRNAFIIIVGCGGVGSHAAAALARSGAGKIRLIDFDQVTLSSLNRHSVATLADVGTPKVDTLRRRLEQITPWTAFDCRNRLFNAAVADDQLAPWSTGQRADYVIDAIDNIESKVDLLHYCATNGLRCISSMGAGCKSDPTKIFVGDISASTEDPLSRATRRRLRARGVASGIPCVYSQEKPGTGKAELQPVSESEMLKGSVNELGILPDFRVRILPVLGSMPAVFGLTAANHVILDLAAYPHEYGAIKGRGKMYEAALASLQGVEERVARHVACEPGLTGVRIPLSQDDVAYLIEELFRGKSVVSGLGNRLVLIRWKKPDAGFLDRGVPGQVKTDATVSNLVCMTKDEAVRHEKMVLKGDTRVEDLYEPAVLTAVEQRWKEERAFSVYR